MIPILTSHRGKAILIFGTAVVLALTASAPALAIDPCDLGFCECAENQLLDLAEYFVPNYPGWDTARKTWMASDGGLLELRFFSYAPGKYELIKFGNSAASETFKVTSSGIYLTAENNINNTNVTRTYPNYPLDWMPRYACRNKPRLNQYKSCHGEEYFFTDCSFSYFNSRHCSIFNQRIEIRYGFDYGYNVGVVDTIVLVGKRDDSVTEKYYYGKNKGFLRWEYIEPSGVMTNWGQQVDELAGSELVHAGCFQP